MCIRDQERRLLPSTSGWLRTMDSRRTAALVFRSGYASSPKAVAWGRWAAESSRPKSRTCSPPSSSTRTSRSSVVRHCVMAGGLCRGSSSQGSSLRQAVEQGPVACDGFTRQGANVLLAGKACPAIENGSVDLFVLADPVFLGQSREHPLGFLGQSYVHRHGRHGTNLAPPSDRPSERVRDAAVPRVWPGRHSPARGRYPHVFL